MLIKTSASSVISEIRFFFFKALCIIRGNISKTIFNQMPPIADETILNIISIQENLGEAQIFYFKDFSSLISCSVVGCKNQRVCFRLLINDRQCQ